MRQRGFAPIFIVLIGLLILAGGGAIYLGQKGQLPFRLTGEANPEPTATTESSPTPTLLPSPSPNLISVTTPKPSPTLPPLRAVSVSGFAYEDRTDDGLFNSDDPRLPNMQFYLYDSYASSVQITTIYSDVNGNFSHTMDVRGGILIKPTASNNFVPKTSEKKYTSSASGLQFGFRSASAPVPGQNVGIIEGDVFHDANRNLVRDSGESSVYFYKLYLVDSSGNYYNTVENAQATEGSGHFKYMNLPIGKTFTIRLSNPTGAYDILKPETSVSLISTKTESKDIQLPVYKY